MTDLISRGSIIFIVDEHPEIDDWVQFLFKGGGYLSPRARDLRVKLRMMYFAALSKEFIVRTDPADPREIIEEEVPLVQTEQMKYVGPLFDLDINADDIQILYRHGYIILLDRFLRDMSLYRLAIHKCSKDSNAIYSLLKFMECGHRLVMTPPPVDPDDPFSIPLPYRVTEIMRTISFYMQDRICDLKDLLVEASSI